jgi:tripartite-type tricarboxylate transporter receptor subunit TctC
MRFRSLLGALALGLAGLDAQAQGSVATYPDHPIRLIVPLAPGGSADILGRMVAKALQDRWGQPVLVENRPGAGTTLGMALLAKAPPDGYTIGLGNIASHSLNPLLMSHLPYDAERDFAPITRVADQVAMLAVNPNRLPTVKTVPELIAYAKAHPGKISFGSSSAGGSMHIGMELFAAKAGIRMTHVPYRGSAPMLTDLVAGNIDLAMDPYSSMGPYVEAGKLRALAVIGPERQFYAPDLPAVREFVPGAVMVTWNGMFAPAGTPPAIVEKLANEIRGFLTQPATQEQLRKLGMTPGADSPADFRKYLVDERARFKPVIEQAGIHLEN